MRLLLPRGGAVLCAAAVVVGSGRPVSAQELASRDTLEDAPLTLVYRPYVRVIVTAIQRNGAFYLPLEEVLERLEINHVVDVRRGMASGRYAAAREYRIDFNAGLGTIGRVTHRVERDRFLITELQIFVLPSLLEQLFGLKSTVDPHLLTVEITSAEELPVAESFRRRQRHALLAATSGSSVAPLRYGRQRRVLDGGVLQYSLAGESADGAELFRFDLLGGGELLGGDFQAAVHGSRGGGSRGPYQSDWRWHYVVGDAHAISQLTLGRFYSNGLQPRTIEGLEITNGPVELRTRLGDYSIDGVVEPNAEIELYLNDGLAAVGRADAFGQYRFALPVSYGTSILRIQSYGASGGVRREERALQIPFAFVPPGRADYELEAGRSRQTGAPAGHGRVAIGLANGLTSSVAVDYDASASTLRWVPYGGVSARLGSGHIVSLDVAPRVLYRASWEGMFPSRANVGATFTRFAATSWLNYAAAADEWSVHAYSPVGPRSAGGMLQGHARLRRGEDGSRNTLLRITAGAQAGFVRPLVGYDWTRVRSASGLVGTDRRDARLGAVAHPLRRAAVPRPLRALLVSGSQTYDVAGRAPRQTELHVSSPITRGGWVEASFYRDRLTRTTRFELHVVVEDRRTRSATTMSTQTGAQRLTQSLSGTVAYDSRSRALVLSDRAWIGQSAVLMRFFVDRNGNGRFDAGEEPVPGATIRFDRAVRLESGGAGVVRATDLPAYQRVTANVDVSGVRNPLWMPKAQLFAFITDPNRYKPIDIPFFVAGVVEGTVVRRRAGEDRPVAGLKLRLRRVDMDFQVDLPTFSDGTFYHMGVPPGRYTIEPDSVQLEILGVSAEPATRTFEVRETSSGDFVERLDFVLVPVIARVEIPDSTTSSLSGSGRSWCPGVDQHQVVDRLRREIGRRSPQPPVSQTRHARVCAGTRLPQILEIASSYQPDPSSPTEEAVCVTGVGSSPRSPSPVAADQLPPPSASPDKTRAFSPAASPVMKHRPSCSTPKCAPTSRCRRAYPNRRDWRRSRSCRTARSSRSSFSTTRVTKASGLGTSII
jgi:hypothetical protein